MQKHTADLSLRPATPADDSFLLELYASTRSEELASFGWDEDQKQTFIMMQFRIRERGHSRADDRIVVLNEVPIGRMVVTRDEAAIRLRDIALLPQYRNAGIGTRLIEDLLTEAKTTRKLIRIHVVASSRAVRLYERLGFRRSGESAYEAAYLEMKWVAPTP